MNFVVIVQYKPHVEHNARMFQAPFRESWLAGQYNCYAGFASCDLYPHVHQHGPYIESELISFLGSAGSLFDLTLPLFRGNDTRTNFVIHLREALNNEQQVKVFIDEDLPKGQSIGPSLSKAIESSHVSIVVFS
ncbi:hypothetical protein S83_047467 [Arachis hypogaea]